MRAQGFRPAALAGLWRLSSSRLTAGPAIHIGNPHYAPSSDDVVALLERTHNVVVNLRGVGLDNPSMSALRSATTDVFGLFRS